MFELILPKEFFEYWLSRLVSGDIESPEYRKMIADIFINSIYVLDDGLKLGLNFSDGVDTIPLHQWNDAQCSDSLGYAPPFNDKSEPNDGSDLSACQRSPIAARQ